MVVPDLNGIQHYTDSRVDFNDTNVGVKGFILCDKSTIEQKVILNGKNTHSVSVKCYKITIYVTSIGNNGITYDKPLESMNDYRSVVEKFLKDNVKLLLFATKLFVAPNKDVTGFNKQIKTLTHYHRRFYYKDLAKLKTQYIDTYFHPNRDEIWQICNFVDYHSKNKKGRRIHTLTQVGQTASAHFILYGPPGTGKSSFIKRIAIALGRQILSVNIIGLSKYQLYNIFNHPESYLSFDVRNYQCVFVLEEMDKTIQWLVDSYDPTNTESCSIGDLLELFQGPLTVNGSIIFATTNNLETIEKICPALIREGRLTPKYFGYLDRKSVQDMVKMYVGIEATIGVDVLQNTKTSSLIHVINHTLASNNTKFLLDFLKTAT
jgi:hypothetical protein